jgi:beta-lactamase class A
MIGRVSAAITELFGQAGCTGQLCVQSLDGRLDVAVDADLPVVAASVIKVCVALEAETQFADGRLDPRERVTLLASRRTPGPVGFSLYRDDVAVSLQDLVVAMLTISDNDATDALLERLGIDAVNAGCARLGLAGTVIVADLRTAVNSIGLAAGFSGWDAMSAWASQPHSEAEERRVMQRIRAADALTADHATRTTPRDMATLLRLIWTGQAGPPQACRRVRQLMGQQLTRHRLAAAFPPPARVSAKSGGLVGVIRNEAGVIEYPGGSGYAAAVFTQSAEAPQGGAAIDRAIGAAAASAISKLRDS